VSSVAEPKLIIYGLRCTCHPGDGVRYVGRTIHGARKRLVRHKYQARKGSEYPVYRWIRKHGEGNIESTVLAVAGAYEDLARLEGEQIEAHSTGPKPLLNMATVEDGVLTYRHSPETRARISAVHKGREIPQHVIEFRSKAFSGEGNGMAKLTRRKVAEIIFLAWNDVPLIDIAAIYDVHPPQITRIIKGERWRSAYRPWGDTPPSFTSGKRTRWDSR